MHANLYSASKLRNGHCWHRPGAKSRRDKQRTQFRRFEQVIDVLPIVSLGVFVASCNDILQDGLAFEEARHFLHQEFDEYRVAEVMNNVVELLFDSKLPVESIFFSTRGLLPLTIGGREVRIHLPSCHGQ